VTSQPTSEQVVQFNLEVMGMTSTKTMPENIEVVEQLLKSGNRSDLAAAFSIGFWAFEGLDGRPLTDENGCVRLCQRTHPDARCFQQDFSDRIAHYGGTALSPLGRLNREESYQSRLTPDL